MLQLPFEGRLKFENVCFKYPKNTVTVLDDISLEILPGEYIALVGPSGSGKSTIVKLLERFYDPSNGAIFVDG